MATLISGLKTQVMAMIPQLVETAEPQIEAQLRKTLQQIKVSKPEEASLFLTNWTKLNNVVQQELAPASAMGGKKRKTRKHKKRT